MSYSPPTFLKKELSDEATRTRRNLLVVVAMWAMVIPLGLAPTQIAVLGISLSEPAISIQALTSIALTYFWVSFIVYAYPNWVKWWHDYRSALISSSAVLDNVRNDIALVESKCASLSDKERKLNGFTMEITIITDGPITRHRTPEDWERVVSNWKEHTLPNTLKQHKQLRMDIYLRTSWDYWLPASTIVAPISYLLHAVWQWYTINDMPMMFGSSTV